MIIRFNNDNIWEIIENNNGITCYKRDYGKYVSKANIDVFINEDMLVPEGRDDNKFSFLDWKSFFGDSILSKIAMNSSTEQYALPMIYYCKYILGYNNGDKMTRVLESRYRFEK